MKKNISFLLILLLTISITFFITACKKDDTVIEQPEPSIQIVRPITQNLNVDVTERPVGLSIGTFTLNKIYIDEIELNTDAYLTRNNYFIFTCEYYGFFGVGEHAVKLEFEEEDISFNLNVADSLSPRYTYDLDEAIMFNSTDIIEFPVVDRFNDYQDYDCKYVAYNSENQEIYNQQNIEMNASSLVLSGLEIGDYRLKVQIRKFGSVLKQFDCNFSVEDYYDNIFGYDNLDNWFKIHSTIIEKDFDETENALTFKTNGRNGLSGRYYVVYFPVNTFQSAIAKGCTTLSFKYKVNDIFESSAYINQGIKSDYAGIRIFGKTTKTLDVDSIGSSTSGVYPYKDLTYLSTSYQTVKINLSEFLAMGNDVNYFAMVISGDANSVVYFKDARFNKEESGLYLEDIADSENSYNWLVSNSAASIVNYDEQEEAFAYSLKSANDALTGRNYVAYYNINNLKSAKNAGYSKLTFKIKANSTLINSTGEKGIRIFGKTKFALDDVGISTNIENGIYEYMDITNLGLDYATVEIDIDEFLALSDGINYFGIVLAGDVGSEIYITDAAYTE